MLNSFDKDSLYLQKLRSLFRQQLNNKYLKQAYIFLFLHFVIVRKPYVSLKKYIWIDKFKKKVSI